MNFSMELTHRCGCDLCSAAIISRAATGRVGSRKFQLPLWVASCSVRGSPRPAVTLTFTWTRTFITLHFATHAHDVPAFSSPDFSSPAFSVSPFDMLSGVPQGSVFGPNLFLLYVNELPSWIQSSINMFADDTKVWRVIETDLDYTTLQMDIDVLLKWSDQWLLRFNSIHRSVKWWV